MGPGGQACRSVSDPDPGSGDMGSSLPNSLYAELRHVESGTTLPVMLEGVGGNYSGQTRAFSKCDPAGNYFVERLVLVDAAGGPVATAVRSGSSYVVTYAKGGSTTASGFSRYYTSFTPASTTTVPSIMSVSASSAARQGERLTVTAAAMASADDCGMREMQWFLTTSPGAMTSPAASVLISGESGSGQLRIPTELAPGTYTLEGRLTSKTGRYALIRRQSAADTSYSLYNSATGSYSTLAIPVIRVEVAQNPSADRTAPQAVSMSAAPARAGRCQQVSLSLTLSDEQALPPSQEVKLSVGPLSQPDLLRMTVTGGAMLSGLFTVPLDAPGGIWVAYPESVVDAAGNVASGSLSADKFTLSGVGVSSPKEVQAATFLVDVPEGAADMGAAAPDLGGADMRPTDSPAQLSGISVAASATAEMPVSVTITWTGTGLK